MKLRAWNPKTKTMWYEGEMNGFKYYRYHMTKNGENWSFIRNGKIVASSKDCILEQASGRKDIKGKLMYEGDIVKLSEEVDSNSMHLPQTENFTVEFNEKEAGYQFDHTSGLRNLGGHHIPLLVCIGKGVVVGDIHRNPELAWKG